MNIGCNVCGKWFGHINWLHEKYKEPTYPNMIGIRDNAPILSAPPKGMFEGPNLDGSWTQTMTGKKFWLD